MTFLTLPCRRVDLPPARREALHQLVAAPLSRLAMAVTSISALPWLAHLDRKPKYFLLHLCSP
ncbi:hypothetical protein B0I35DRAFT_443981 [Stachybotrys elegans]|uniref:Uncharacterized protein n=1 Tax=Stachybotrys elegans TaxID=80388 RepID=A0A8K0WM46_9HYPO|nr:hypothetical protein B0I35DRAFT_443981 [Stachybotrys elegans]